MRRPLPPRRIRPTPTEAELRDEIADLCSNEAWYLAISAEDRSSFLAGFALIEWEKKEREKRPSEFFDDFPPADYTSYLQSSVWKKIRQRVVTAQRGLCYRCSSPAKDVHHRCYAPNVMQGQDDTQLVALCRRCHELVEFDDDGKRRSRLDQEIILAEEITPVRAGISEGRKDAIADRLRDLRGDYGKTIGIPKLSQTQFAEKLGVSVDIVRFWERGQIQSLCASDLANLHRVTGVDLNRLITGGDVGDVKDPIESVSTEAPPLGYQEHDQLVFIEGVKAKAIAPNETGEIPLEEFILWERALVLNSTSSRYEIWFDVKFDIKRRCYDFGRAKRMGGVNGQTRYIEERILAEWGRIRAIEPSDGISMRQFKHEMLGDRYGTTKD